MTTFPLAQVRLCEPFSQEPKFTKFSTLSFVDLRKEIPDVETELDVVFGVWIVVNPPQTKFKSGCMNFLISGVFGALVVDLFKCVWGTFTDATFSEGLAGPIFQNLVVDKFRICVFSKPCLRGC